MEVGGWGELWSRKKTAISPLTPTPTLTPGETLLSPLVMCGPHGLKFLKPVELRLPHCASMTPDGWSFALKSSDSSSGMLSSLCPLGALGTVTDWSLGWWNYPRCLSACLYLCPCGLVGITSVLKFPCSLHIIDENGKVEKFLPFKHWWFGQRLTVSWSSMKLFCQNLR